MFETGTKFPLIQFKETVKSKSVQGVVRGGGGNGVP